MSDDVLDEVSDGPPLWPITQGRWELSSDWLQSPEREQFFDWLKRHDVRVAREEAQVDVYCEWGGVQHDWHGGACGRSQKRLVALDAEAAALLARREGQGE